MAHLLAPLLGLDLGLGSARSMLALAKTSNIENVLAIAIRVVVFGALITGLRKAASWSQVWVDRYLYPTAYIAVSDTSYLWVMAWLAQDPAAQSQIKDFQLSTSEWREVRRGAGNALKVETQRTGERAPGSTTVGEHNSSWSAEDIIGQVLPAYHQGIRITHGKNRIWVTRRMGFFARSNLRTVDHIEIRTLVWQKTALKDFLSAAHHRYFTKQDQELLIFHPKRINAFWQKPVSRPARPWSSVILPSTIKENLPTDVEKFLSEKEISWYSARGIPHRRGYLFHGTPGSGKTTLATAIASKLRLDIYVINPSQRGMDDAKLSKLFRDCPARSVILIEDIDCIFPSNRGRTVTHTQDDDEAQKDTSNVEVEGEVSLPPAIPHPAGGPDLNPSTVTLSGLLNAIDGVSSQEGCVLIASTNHPEHLDPALRRAGRFDVQIQFDDATPEQASDIFKHFYPHSEANEKATDSIDEKEYPRTEADVDKLATDFAAAIFSMKNEGCTGKVGISMAALQGFLLGYKEDYPGAIRFVAGWAAQHAEPKKPRKEIIPTTSKLASAKLLGKRNAQKAVVSLKPEPADEDEAVEIEL